VTALEKQLAASIDFVREKQRQEKHMTTAIEVHKPNGAALATRLEFSEAQQEMIYSMYAKGAGREEFAVLMEIASARRLNPLLKQIHFVKRWDSKTRSEVWAAQASIDGLRAIAERTGKYDGQDEPEYDEQSGQVLKATVRVYRKDWQRPSVGVAHWAEYVQKTKEGAPTRFWATMPHVMLAKCAEALALRKAFPEDMSGLYVPEEMAQAESAPAARELPKITPFDPDNYNPQGSNPKGLADMIRQAERVMVDDQLDEARALLGSKARMIAGSAAVAIQTEIAAGNVSADYHKQLSKDWQRVNRRLAKLEEEHMANVRSTDVVASFVDDDDAERAAIEGADDV
jgi:phage recombination protein Bet